MLRISAVIVAVVLTFGVIVAQEEVAGNDEVKVNLSAENQPVQEVAAEVTEQTDIQVAVTANTQNNLTGKLEDKTVEESVKLLAEGSQASWMRAYFLEKSPPDEAYTAEELLAKLGEAREEWMESLTDEQRRELFGQFRPGGPGAEDGRRGPPEREDAAPADGDGEEGVEAAEAAPRGERGERGERAEDGERPERGERGGFGQMLAGPGGGVAAMQAPEGAAEGARGGFGMMANYDDPIRRLLLPERSDTITLELTETPLLEVLDAFTMECRFLVVVDEEIEGNITLALEDAPLSEALDAIAEATGAEWRAVYVLGQPRELTQQEIAQREVQREERRDARFNQMWSDFWQSSPAERAASIQRRIDRVERMTQRLENAPPERRARMERRSARMLDRMVGYSTQLSPEQRLELKPYLQALARQRAN